MNLKTITEKIVLSNYSQVYLSDPSKRKGL